MSTLHERIRSLEMFYAVDKVINPPMLLHVIRDLERELVIMHTRMNAFAELYSKTLATLNRLELQLAERRPSP